MATLRDKDKEAALDARIRRIHEENRKREERRLEVERDRLSWRASGSDRARISQYVRVTAPAPEQHSSSGSPTQQSAEDSDEPMASDDDVATKKSATEELDDVATNKLTAEGPAACIHGGDSEVPVAEMTDRRRHLSRSHDDGDESSGQLPPSGPDGFRHQLSVPDVQLNDLAKCTVVQTESQTSSCLDSQPHNRQICSQIDQRVSSLESDHPLKFRPALEAHGVLGADRFPDVAAWPGQDVVVAAGVEDQQEDRPGSVSPISALLMSAGTGDVYCRESAEASSVVVDSVGGDHSLRRPTSPSQSRFEPRPVPAYPAEVQLPTGQSHVAQLTPTASMLHPGAQSHVAQLTPTASMLHPGAQSHVAQLTPTASMLHPGAQSHVAQLTPTASMLHPGAQSHVAQLTPTASMLHPGAQSHVAQLTPTASMLHPGAQSHVAQLTPTASMLHPGAQSHVAQLTPTASMLHPGAQSHVAQLTPTASMLHPGAQSHVAQLTPTASMAHPGAESYSNVVLPYTQQSPYPPVSHTSQNTAAGNPHSWTHHPPDVTYSSSPHQAVMTSDLYQRRVDRSTTGFNPTPSEIRIQDSSLGSGFPTRQQSRYIQPVPQSPEVDNSGFYSISRSRLDSTGGAEDVMSRFQHDFPTPPRNTRHPRFVSAPTDSPRTPTHLHRSLPTDASFHPQHTSQHAQNPTNVLHFPRRPPNITSHDTSLQNASAYSSDNTISHHPAHFSEATSNSVLHPNMMDQHLLRAVNDPHPPGVPHHTSDAANGVHPYSPNVMHQLRNPLNSSYLQDEQEANIPGTSRDSQPLVNAASYPPQPSDVSQRWQHPHDASGRDLFKSSDTSHLQLRSDTAYHPQHPSNNPQHPQHHLNLQLFPGNDPRIQQPHLNDQQYPLSDSCHSQCSSINHPHPVNVPAYPQLSSNDPQHPHHLSLQQYPRNSPRIQQHCLNDQQYLLSDRDHTQHSSNDHQQPQHHINLQQYPGNNPRSQQRPSNDPQHPGNDPRSQQHPSNDPQHPSNDHQHPGNDPRNQQHPSNDPQHHGIDQQYLPISPQHPPNHLDDQHYSGNDPCHPQHTSNNPQRTQYPFNNPYQPNSSSDYPRHLQHTSNGTSNSSHLPSNHTYASYDSQDAAHVSHHPKLSGSPLNRSGDPQHPSCASTSAHSVLNPQSDSSVLPAEPYNESSITHTSSTVNLSLSPPASDLAYSRCAESAGCVSVPYFAGRGYDGAQTRRPRLPHRFQDSVAPYEFSPLRRTDSNSPGIAGSSQTTAPCEMYQSSQNTQGQDAGCDISSDLGSAPVVNNPRAYLDHCREESSRYVCDNLPSDHCSVSTGSGTSEEGNLNRSGRYAADAGHQCDDPVQVDPGVLDGSAPSSLNDGRLQTEDFNSDVSSPYRAEPAGVPMTPPSAAESSGGRPQPRALLGMSGEQSDHSVSAPPATTDRCVPIDNFEQQHSQGVGESVASLLPQGIDEATSVLPVSGFPTPPASPRHRLGNCAQDAINPGSEEDRDCEVEVVEGVRVSMGNEEHMVALLNSAAPVERLRRPLRSHNRNIDTGSVAVAMAVSSSPSSSQPTNEASGSSDSSTTSGRRPTLTSTGVDLSVPPPGYHPLSNIVTPRSDGPKAAVEDFQRESVDVSVDVSRPPPVVNTTRESSGHPFNTTRDPSGRPVNATLDSSGHPFNTTRDPSGRPVHATLETSGHAVNATRDSPGHPFNTTRDPSGRPVNATLETSGHPFNTTRDPSGRPVNATLETSGHAVNATRDSSGHPFNTTRDPSGRPVNTAHDPLGLPSNPSIEPMEPSSAFSTYSEPCGVPVSSAPELSAPPSAFSATVDSSGLPVWRTAAGVSKPPRALVARRQEPSSDDAFSRADRDMDWRCSHAPLPPASVRRAPDTAPSIPAVGANFQCVTFVDGQVVHNYDQSLLKVADIRLRDCPRQ